MMAGLLASVVLVVKVIGLAGKRGEEAAARLQSVYRWLMAQEVEVVVEPHVLQSTGAPQQQALQLSDMARRCDLIVVVGGDGSMLGAAKALANSDTPLVGVNLGRVGFLTDISPDRLDQQLLPVLSGDGDDDYRTVLTTQILRRGAATDSGLAINEVLVHSGGFAELLDMEIRIDGEPVRLRADGLIISTTTGSTAYALSAGGPLVDPSLSTMVLVPVLSQSVGSRPIVVPHTSTIQIQVFALEEGEHVVSFDGHDSIVFDPGDQIEIKAVPRGLRLTHPPGYSFYQACQTKLGWMNPPSQRG